MPDQLRLGSPGQPLQTLIEVLGLSAEILHIGEGPEELLFLERQLPTTAAMQLTLPHLVPSHEIALNGEYLAIVGGKAMRRWEAYVPSVPPDQQRVERIRSEATKNLKWVHFTLNHLTPLQLRVTWEPHGEGSREEQPISLMNDPIASLLSAHVFACCLLYTADQTVKLSVDAQHTSCTHGGPLWQCTYAAEKYVAVLTLGNTEAVRRLLQARTQHDAWAAIDSIAEYTVWAYSGERGAADRLGVVQGVIAHDFHSRDLAIDGQELLQHAVALKQRIEWGWKAFIEGKLDTYFSQVREAEQAVDTAIKGYNEQVHMLTKTLIDNMLAAVGIVVASFIAAVFKDPFNPHIFQVGTTLYALYLLVFPMLFGLISTWQRYKDSQRAFETRKASLSQRLSVDEVERTVGASVQEREIWFKGWFRKVAVTYSTDSATVEPIEFTFCQCIRCRHRNPGSCRAARRSPPCFFGFQQSFHADLLGQPCVIMRLCRLGE